MKNSKKNNLLFIIYLICFWDFSHVLQLSNFQLICFFDVYKLNMKRLICFFDILQILIGHLICFFNKFKIADQNFENSLICLVCLIRLICFLVLPRFFRVFQHKFQTEPALKSQPAFLPKNVVTSQSAVATEPKIKTIRKMCEIATEEILA